MDFFSKLSEQMGSYTIQLTIQKNADGSLTVMFMPKLTDSKGNEKQEFTPLVFNGSSEDIDAAFLSSIKAGVQKLNSLQVNIDEFEKSLKDKTDDKKSDSKTTKPVEKKADLFAANTDAGLGKVDSKDKDNISADARSDDPDDVVDEETGEVLTKEPEKKGNSIKPGKATPSADDVIKEQLKAKREAEEAKINQQELPGSTDNDDFGDEEW